MPTVDQAKAVTELLRERSKVPDHVFKVRAQLKYCSLAADCVQAWQSVAKSESAKVPEHVFKAKATLNPAQTPVKS